MPLRPEEALAWVDDADGTVPQWRAWPAKVLVAPVRVALLRAEIARDAGALRREERGELLYQAVRGTEIGSAPHAAALVEELSGSGDAVLEGEALRLARDGLHAGVLEPAFVRAVLTGLLDSRTEDVVIGALDELAEPWAALDPLPTERLTGLLASATADAALAAAARHGHGELLRRAAEDRELQPRMRRRALGLLGETARRDDVPAVLALAAEDPLLLGGPAVDCLRAMHRRGHFITDPDIPAVLGLALADHAIPAPTVAAILFTSRHELLRLLVDAAPNDPSWPRRLDLLVALDGQGTAGLPVAAEIARVLPLAPAPAPFLHALRALRATEAEDAVLAALAKAPAVVLDTLEAVGGDRTVRALAMGLGLGTPEPGEIAPELRAVRHRALELLWLLTTDPQLRRRILARLDPTQLPARVAADLGSPNERELTVLASHLDPDKPVTALCRLAAHGGPGTLPVLADLLLRVVGDLTAARETAGTAGPVPDREPAVAQEAVDALCGLGRRLHARGRIRPVCLLDAGDAEAAGHALVADLALGLLDRPGLAAGEQAVLLRLLLDLPHTSHGRVRSRVHRLLRHPDRHVRKHVVALLARDTAGDGVQALSAGLIALTGPTGDPQTVRQTLTALGQVGARWASGAIAGCLDHPNMNVRKTAARALCTAGTPRAVPPLLHRLGRDDNPGLRTLLVKALRAVLGETYAATVTAAAAREADGRISARLLSDLAGTAGPHQDDEDLRRLTEEGWDPTLALRVAERGADGQETSSRPAVSLSGRLRPYLVDWLELAATSAKARRAVLRVLPEVCPGPWQTHEYAAFARGVAVLLDGLAEAEADGRDRLIELLEAVAPRLRPTVAAGVVAAVRALQPRPAGRRSTLPLLRLCAAVVVRADLDRELAATGLAPAPHAARARLLRETFGVGDEGACENTARRCEPAAGLARSAQPPTTSRHGEFDGRPQQPCDDGPWRAELAAAVKSVETLAAFRHRAGAPGSRAVLAMLIDVQADASPDVRAAIVDWMTELQPLGVPVWTLAEVARAAAAAPTPRVVQVGDLDQPRSAAQRERLLGMLASDVPGRRDAAARTLLAWPEPDGRAVVLDAYLRGRADVPVGSGLVGALRRALAEADPEALSGDGMRAGRLARLAAGLDARDLEPLLPVLLHMWEQGPAPTRPDAAQALRHVPADILAAHLEPRIAAGATGLLDLLAGRPLLRTPALTRLSERRPDARLILVDGPLRGRDAPEEDAAALRTLRDRATVAPPRPPSRQELTLLVRSGDPERIRRALAHLTEHTTGIPQSELADLLRELLTHPRTGIRLHAHRSSRVLLDRETHLRLTETLLDDPQPDVVRSAIRVLTHARWQPAIPALTSLLDHAHVTVRQTAETGLVHVGPAAVPALRRAVSRARPDRRARYADLLARVAQQEPPG